MRNRIPVILLAIFIPLLLSPAFAIGQEKTTISTVVIDAGHGGKDPGTIGQHTQEKKITLAVALKVGALIRNNSNGVKVLYTRDKDVFIELFERAEIANRNKADLFISIHCNSNPSHSLHGAETYIMGLHRTHANLEIAKQENASILMEPDYARRYNGFDPNSDESYITFTLFQNAYLDQSSGFATLVQDELNDRVGLDDRGVRQAGFLVLYKTTMPSVLIECGFLSNTEEEQFLMSEKGQDHIASAIFRAFKSFKEKTEGHPLAVKDRQTPEKENTSVPGHDSSMPEKKIPGEPAKKETEKKPVAVAKKEPSKGLPAKTIKKPAAPVKQASDEVAFRVQFKLSAKEIKNAKEKFPGVPDIRMYRHQNYYKYTSGNTQDLDEALKLLDTLKSKGYSDAFVVAFHGTERITIAEAKGLLAK